MKEFVIYTVLRLLLFVASLITTALVWALVIDSREVPLFLVIVIAFAISGVLSYFLLSSPREAFAKRVEERAARATAAFDARRAREDDLEA